MCAEKRKGKKQAFTLRANTWAALRLANRKFGNFIESAIEFALLKHSPCCARSLFFTHTHA